MGRFDVSGGGLPGTFPGTGHLALRLPDFAARLAQCLVGVAVAAAFEPGERRTHLVERLFGMDLQRGGGV